MLIIAAIVEAGTGVALLIVPSLAGQLFGEQLAGVAIPVARVAGTRCLRWGSPCWPGPPLVGMLVYNASVTSYLAYLGSQVA